MITSAGLPGSARNFKPIEKRAGRQAMLNQRTVFPFELPSDASVAGGLSVKPAIKKPPSCEDG